MRATEEWRKLVGESTPSILSAVVLAVLFGITQRVISQVTTPKIRSWLLLRRFKVPMIAEEDEDVYVERKSLEARVAEHVSEPVASGKYLVVVGPRGSGKSTMIKKVLKDRRKVVYVKLSKEISTIASKLRLGLGIPKDKDFETVDCFRRRSGGLKPVLVVELDSNVEAATVRTQSQEVKLICVDNKLAHGIIVLSDANAAFKLNPDPDRQDFLWVGDFEEHEMHAFLDKCGVLPARGNATAASKALRQRFFDEAGARPQKLFAVARAARRAAGKALAKLSEGATEAEKQAAADQAEQQVFEREIEAARVEADADLISVLENVNTERASAPDEFKQLLSRMCSAGRSEGVPRSAAPFTPAVAAELMKPPGMRVISFNLETELFQFYSRAHEVAAMARFERDS